MSARIMEFQFEIERILEADALLGIRQTLREKFTSLRARPPLPSDNFSPALAPPYRSTSTKMDMGTFRESLSDHLSLRHSSPLSVRSDSSPSVALVLLGPSPHMDSSRVVIDLSLKTIELTGRISDYDSS